MTTGKHTIKGWSKIQALVALSSGESELYVSLKAATETLGLMSMLKDLNWKVIGHVYRDASAALGIIDRTRLGKTRHIDTSLQWIQQTAAERHLKFSNVLGKNNSADLYTKYLDVNKINTHVKAFNYYTEKNGRADDAPKLHLASRSWMQCTGTEPPDWEWLQFIIGLRNKWMKLPKGDVNAVAPTRRVTGLGPWVLWGHNWPVQGSNGLIAAQLSQPRGSTLTFQLYIGVPWVHALRHGSAMHPRGRHSREGRIPWSHGKSHNRAREHQPHNTTNALHNHLGTTIGTTKPSGRYLICWAPRWSTNVQNQRDENDVK